MPYIHSKGSPTSRIWVIAERPYSSDIDKGYIFSGGMGFIFDKMMQEAGIRDYYVTCRRPDSESPETFAVIESQLNNYRPPIIIVLEEAGKILCPELQPKFRKKTADEDDSDVNKYAGSLLISKVLNYPHYIIPTLSPDTIVKDWKLRDIAVSLDLGKAKSEFDYWKQNGILEPLPERVLKYEMDFEEVLHNLQVFENAPLLSVDIETVYTNTKSLYYPHPGYPVTIGIANGNLYGISFNLFWPKASQTVELWRRLEKVLWNVPNLGQNYFNFDSSFLTSLGFRIDLQRVQDTLIRHAILWPELPHKLQFQTRQYTREPYYKDDGKRWNLKDMRQLRRYNCLDVCVTYEIYEAQEIEFNDRPYLR